MKIIINAFKVLGSHLLLLVMFMWVGLGAIAWWLVPLVICGMIDKSGNSDPHIGMWCAWLAGTVTWLISMIIICSDDSPLLCFFRS